MRNKDWDRRQLEEQDVYRESRHPLFCWIIRSVTHEISYIQPIHWWDFRFTFWQSAPTTTKDIVCCPSATHSAVSDASRDWQLSISQIREENIEIATTVATKAAQDSGQSIAQQLTKILAQMML